jgi:hypothetical protein
MSDDELVRRYLLGGLSGDEQEALEQRLLREDDLFELAEAMEAEVLEDYARGELTSEQKEQVARYLAASPEGRLRLAVIRGLAALPAAAGKLLPFSRPAPNLERPKVRVEAIAAMLVMVLGAALLAGIYVPGFRIKDGRVLPPSPPPPINTVATPTPTPVPTPPSVIFVAMIALSNLRGEEEIQSFDIPDRPGLVELHLTLSAGDEGYPSYRVVVLNDDLGREVKTSEGLHTEGDNGHLTLRVDADQLTKGRYSLEVQGVTSEGTTEDLAFPVFEVHEP